MSVRGKIFLAMGVLVVLVSAAYIGTTQGYLGSLFARYYTDGGGSNEGMISLEGVSQYILAEMKIKAFNMTLFIAGAALILGYWLSGLIVNPLNKLIRVMRRVAGGELATEVPIERADEYGQVGEAFNSMTGQLRDLMDNRKRLVEDVAHELRTPLAIIQSKLELIQQSQGTVKPEALLSVHDEVLRLIRLVDELQLLNTAEAGELTLNKEPTNLPMLMEELIELVQPEADEYGVSLVVSCNVDMPTVCLDPRRMKQVFLNLLTNALRHTREGGKITVCMQIIHDCVSISITDTGSGIPEGAIPHLFDRFFRADPGRGRTAGGSGLGLSIAHQIVAVHGGSIQVRSEVGVGSEFTVKLPLG